MSSFQTNIGAISIRAIQDLAPLLPLVGTTLCQDRVAWGLNLGLLYPAAAPMTMFGSLGIALVGFIALVSSIDVPYFHGPTRLKNAGFRASGMGKLLLHVNERKHHLFVVEDRLRTILAKKKVWEVEMNAFSPDIVWWNLGLVFATIVCGAFGILPYIYLIHHSIPNTPFRESWLFPVLRIGGSGIVAVNIQLLFQLRILEETYYRLRFLAADNFLKDTGKSLPEYWDPNRRSRSVFDSLRRCFSNPTPAPGEGSGGLTRDDAKMILHAIHTMGSFRFSGPSLRPPAGISAGQGNSATQDNVPNDNQAERGAPQGQDNASVALTASILLFFAQNLTTLGLVLTQIFLFVGGAFIIVGYIGCFGIVQANRDPEEWAGPLVWVLSEITLFLGRTTIWAWNPSWDDPKSPIVLEKMVRDQPSTGSTDEGGLQSRKPSYGIGWSLDSVTADDMHALVIGIDDYKHSKHFQSLTGAENDGKKMQRYLEDKLLVPHRQIRTLYNDAATKGKIVEEIKSLKHRISVTPQAPVIIYYAGHSTVSGSSTYLIPYPDNFLRRDEEPKEADWLAYSEIVNLLQQVGRETTDNIVLILDCCHAGAMARNTKWKRRDSLIPLAPSLRDANVSSSSGGRHSPHPRQSNEVEHPLGTMPTSTSFIASQDREFVTAEGSSVPSPSSPNETQFTPRRNGHASPNRRSTSIVTEETSEMLIGYRSHILLAGAAANQEAHETKEGVPGGKFTQFLLDVLEDAERSDDIDDLKKLTYKELVARITKRFTDDEIPIKWADPDGTEREGKGRLIDYQRVLCTTIYQDQPLFDGLFKRRTAEGSRPIVTVRYTDD